MKIAGLVFLISLIVGKAIRAALKARNEGVSFQDGWWLVSGCPSRCTAPRESRKPLPIPPTTSIAPDWLFYLREFLTLENAALIFLATTNTFIWVDIFNDFASRLPNA